MYKRQLHELPFNNSAAPLLIQQHMVLFKTAEIGGGIFHGNGAGGEKAMAKGAPARSNPREGKVQRPVTVKGEQVPDGAGKAVLLVFPVHGPGKTDPAEQPGQQPGQKIFRRLSRQLLQCKDKIGLLHLLHDQLIRQEALAAGETEQRPGGRSGGIIGPLQGRPLYFLQQVRLAGSEAFDQQHQPAGSAPGCAAFKAEPVLFEKQDRFFLQAEQCSRYEAGGELLATCLLYTSRCV